MPVVGGMSSGAMAPGQTVLIRGREALYSGAVGVLLRGDRRCRAVVSQGCRPIGRPLVVTKGRENVIEEVGGRPPLEYLKGLYDELPVGRPAALPEGAARRTGDERVQGGVRPRRLPGPQPVRDRPGERGAGRHRPGAGRADGAVPAPRRGDRRRRPAGATAGGPGGERPGRRGAAVHLQRPRDADVPDARPRRRGDRRRAGAGPDRRVLRGRRAGAGGRHQLHPRLHGAASCCSRDPSSGGLRR